MESDFPQRISINEQAAIKDKGRLGHAIVDLLPVNLLELLPFRSDHDGFRSLAGLEGGTADRDLFLNWQNNLAKCGTSGTMKRTRLEGQKGARLLKISPDLVTFHLRIIDIDISFFRLEVLDEGDCRRLSSVTSIGLEGEAENGNTLTLFVSDRHCVKRGRRTFPVIVLNMVSTTRFEKRLFWCSFISTTCLQYAATSGRWRLSLR